MALTLDQETKLAKIADALSAEDIIAAVEIARDEAVRVILTKIYASDAHDISPAKSADHENAKMMLRKMYLHHSEWKKYPWSLKDMKDGKVTKDQIITYFNTLVDPAPGSLWSRPIGT